MVDNTGFISRLGATTQLVDGTDAIHTGIIKTLNVAMGQNRLISTAVITQGTTSNYTHYEIEKTDGGDNALTAIRDGMVVSVPNKKITTHNPAITANASGEKDWYGLIVIADGTESGETLNNLYFREGAVTGKANTSTATVAELKSGDIPIALVKYTAGSAIGATRDIQWLTGNIQTSRGFSAINGGSETFKINPTGTISYGSATITLPSSTGTLARTADVTSSIAAISTGNGGLIPSAGSAGEFLKHDGTFGTPAYIADTNTQNVFTSSFVDSTDDILLRLTKSGASSGTQDIKFVSGSNITLTHTDANNITIASTDTNTQLTLLDEDNMASDSATAAASQQSIKAYVDGQVSGLVSSAPTALDTLNELAAALGDDANFATTTSTALGNRLRIDSASQNLTATQKSNAITNLGLGAASTLGTAAIADGGTGLATADQIHTFVTGLGYTTSSQISTEAVQDIVGAMFTSNTETRVGATYDDTSGKINVVVDDMTADTNKFLSGLSLSGTTITATVTGGSNQTLDIASVNTDTNTNIGTTDIISGLTALSSIDIANDSLIFRDNSDSGAVKKLSLTELMGAVTESLIPSLSTAKITSGTFATARIPTLAQSKITSLTSDLAAKVPTSRTIAGKALSNNLTLGINAAGKLEINDGGTAVVIQNASNADVIFDNSKITTATLGLDNVTNVSQATIQAATLTAAAASDVGLGNVNNTADTAKPVSTAQQTALDLKANLASPTFTGTVSGITKAMVGLTNVSDITTAAIRAGVTHSDVGTTASDVGLGNVTNESKTTMFDDPTFTGDITIPNGGSTQNLVTALNLNTAKNTYPSADATKVGHLTVNSALNLNTMSSNITTNATNIATNVTAIGLNTAKVSYTDASAVSTNTAKLTANATNVTAALVASTSIDNDDKTTILSNIGAGTSSLALGTTSITALAGNTSLLALGTTSSTALAGNTAVDNVSVANLLARADDLTTNQATAFRTSIGAGSSVDSNDYVDAASFSSGTLTIGRTGSLADLTVDISGVNTDTNKFLSGLSLSGSTITATVSGGTNQTLDISSVNTDTVYALTNDLAASEITAIQNIGATTITAAQWGYLGAASGSITNTDSNVSSANLKQVLADFGDETVIIGDADTNVTIVGDLKVTGDTFYSNETIKVVEDNTIAFRNSDTDGTGVIKLTAANPSASGTDNTTYTVTIPAATFTIPTSDTVPNATNVTSSLVAASSISGSDKTSILSNIGAGTSSFGGAFSNLTSKPTTIAGYGITDAFDGAYSSLSGLPTLLTLGTTSTTALRGDTSLFSGSYADLSNKPTLLTLGTSSTTALAGDTSLFSGSYADLTNKPTLLTLGTSSSTALAGDTSLFSGSYADLTNKPTLLTIGTTSSTALAGNTALLALGTSSTTALAGNTTVDNVTKANLLAVLDDFTGDDTVTIGDSGSDTQVTIRGNLSITGATSDLSIADPLVVLGTHNATRTSTSTAVDTGFEIERGVAPVSGDELAHAIFRYNHGNARFEFTNNGTDFFNIPDTSEYGTGLSGSVDVVSSGNVPVATDFARFTDADTLEGLTAAQMRTALDLVVGTDVQAYHARLADIAGLAVTDGGIIVGDGSNFVLETTSTARTSLGAAASGNITASDLTIISGGSDYLTFAGNTDASSAGIETIRINADTANSGNSSFSGSGLRITSVGGNKFLSLNTVLTDIIDTTTPIDDVSVANLRSALNSLSSSGGAANEVINIGNDSGDTINFRGNASIAGNLTVTGDTIYHNETIQVVEDNTLAFRAGDGNTHEVLLTADNPTSGDVTITLPVSAGDFTIPTQNTQLSNSEVIGMALTSLDVSTGADITASDTILSALGKIENRVRLNDDKVTNTNTQLNDTGVTSKLLTGLSVTATTSDVTASNTILEAIGHMEKRIRLNDDKVTNTDTVYSLPTASSTVLGGIKVGSNLTISSGVLSGTADTVYTHPTHNGDDIDIDTTLLSGATVISDLDLNITTDTLGHVTDANATIATRNLTLADLGFTGDADATDDLTAAEIRTLIGTGNGGVLPSAGTSGHFLKHDGTFGALPAKMAFTVRDSSDTDVIIPDGRFIKFVEGNGLDITFTDTDTGDTNDPFGLTFKVADDGISATQLNVSGNGSSGNALLSDGDGSFSWGTAGDATLAGTQTFSGAKTFSAVAKISNGSVSAPALSFSTQANQGMYRISSGSTGFTSSGQLKLTVDPYGITVGDGNSAGYVNAKGTQDLILRTNDGTNSGSITITDGANSDISITPNGTGQVNLGNFQFDVDQTVGSGQDNYVLTYDHANTQISLEEAGGGGASAIGELSDAITTATDNIGLGSGALDSLASGGNYNTALGIDSGTAINTGDYNTMIGYAAGEAATDTSNNTMVGNHAGRYATASSNNTMIGSNAGMRGAKSSQDNVGIGNNALSGHWQNTTGASYNTAVGSGSSQTITTGTHNTTVGYNSLSQITTGSRNVAIGTQTLDAITTLSNIVAVGHQAGTAVTSASNLTAIGYQSANAITTQIECTYVGYQSGNGATGTHNTGVGMQAGKSITGNYNVGVGRNTAWFGGDMDFTTAVGAEAGFWWGHTPTVHDYTTAVGYQAGYKGGSYSTYVGSVTAYNQTGAYSVAVGYQALRSTMGAGNGSGNTAIGTQSMYGGVGAITGSYNTFTGYKSGFVVSSGTGNTGFGYEALDNVRDGAKNIGIGYQAGDSISSGDFNVVIGGADVPSATADSQLSISDGDGGTTWIQGNEDGIVLGALTPLFFERGALDTSAVDFRVPTVQSSSANPNSYPMPFAGTVKAMTCLFTGDVASSSTSNVIRIRKNNGSSGSDIKDVTFTPAQFTKPASGNGGTAATLVKTGSDVALSFSAGDIIMVKRQSGSTDLNNSQVIIWVSYNF